MRFTQYIHKPASVLFTAMLLLSCGRISAADATTVRKVACVGDSITFGSGIKDHAKTYPAQLGQMLGAEWEVKNFGVSGATMLRNGNRPYDKQKAYGEALDYKPDVLVLMLGTNDSKPENWAHKGDFAGDCGLLIEAFQKANPKIRIYLCLPVPAFPGNYGIRDEIIHGEIVPTLRKVAIEKGVTLVDCYAALSGKGTFFPDKIHPNAAGAEMIAATVCEALTGKKPAASPTSK